MKKKKKQHYVTQYYLKSWSRNKKTVLTNINGVAASASTRDVAHINYFYRVQSLGAREKSLLLREIDRSKSVHKQLFRTMVSVCHFLHALPYDNVNPDARAMLMDDANTLKSNIIEDYYWTIEDGAENAYKKLMARDYDNFHYHDFITLLRLAVYQLARTPKSKESTRELMKEFIDKYQIKFDEYYTISSLLTAEDLYMVMIDKLYKMTIIESSLSTNFITNDNPATNLKGVSDKTIELYWPISPTQAVIFSPSDMKQEDERRIKSELLADTKEQRYFIEIKALPNAPSVEKYNDVMWERKIRSIFFLDTADAHKYLCSSQSRLDESSTMP